jgi:2-dehydro-3-deoxyphosphogluconate aldolase / (4S)-4-hydroxy-2-oxoglutarate aldolase
MQLMEYGLTVAKFFPAEQFGGVKTMQALCAPFPDLRFIPTGGIGLANILEYLSFKKVIACGGSWMVKDAYIENGDYDTVTRLTKEAVVLAAACK